MLIIGLGNFPEEYRNTYHNAGFLFLDWLIAEYGAQWKTNKKISGEIAEISTPDAHGEKVKIFLYKPIGYMNESGQGALKAIRYLKKFSVPLIVAHDDSDIAIGKYKISLARGAAGHRGVQSVMRTLGESADLLRIRIGIRDAEKSAPHVKAGEFVLKKVSKNHEKILVSVFKKIGQEIANLPVQQPKD